MTTGELLGEVSRCGFKVVLRDGSPVLERVAVKAAVPSQLMAELKSRRAEIIAHFVGSEDGEVCPLCRAWTRSPADAAFLCNPESRPLEYVAIDADGFLVKVVVSKCHFAG